MLLLVIKSKCLFLGRRTAHDKLHTKITAYQTDVKTVFLRKSKNTIGKNYRIIVSSLNLFIINY